MPSRTPTEKPRIRPIMSALSLVLCAFLWFCYRLQPDALATITFWPPWSWLPIGFALLIPGWRRLSKRARVVSVLAWVLLVLVFNEEPTSLARLILTCRPAPSQRTVRVISLNCAGGNPAAAQEVLQYHPDIILLQETPSEKSLRNLGEAAFGDDAAVLCGLDCSIIVRGQIARCRMNTVGLQCTAGRVKLKNGYELDIASIRLVPPEFRTDIYSPSCWQSQSYNRRIRRTQLRSIMAALSAATNGVPLIVGGDFNAPAADGALREMSPRLRDSFTQAGRGWGNTGINEIPVQRVDQIWVSNGIRPINVTAHRTENSDHRLVICDLLIGR